MLNKLQRKQLTKLCKKSEKSPQELLENEQVVSMLLSLNTKMPERQRSRNAYSALKVTRIVSAFLDFKPFSAIAKDVTNQLLDYVYREKPWLIGSVHKYPRGIKSFLVKNGYLKENHH